jgi:outer membrane protein, heavy metal efflux system
LLKLKLDKLLRLSPSAEFIQTLALISFISALEAIVVVPIFSQDKLGDISLNVSATESERAQSLSKYMDQSTGMTADQAVAHALLHNGDLLAARAEAEATRGLLKQARLRPNPMLDLSRAEQIRGTDSSLMAELSLPLELGGRRSARIEVAQRELEMRQAMVADRERMLAAEVRARFGITLAEVRKLSITEELLNLNSRDYMLVDARVTEGRTPPLERNIILVEVNRIRSMRELNEAKVEQSILDLKNILGMKPEEPLTLRGSLAEPHPLLSLAEATHMALSERPDLKAAIASEKLAEAQVNQARSAGRLDARITAGYQRMKNGFPLRGFNDMGELEPIEMTSHSVRAGISLDLPVRNKNQGAVEAAISQLESAQRRREYIELTIRREVASAYASYERALRAEQIFRMGVYEQASANLRVVYQTYELGSKSLLDYIAEQRRFIDVQNGYVDALLELYQSHLAIDKAIYSTQLRSK